MSKATRTSGDVTELVEQLMVGIAETAGEEAGVRARLLLEHVLNTISHEGLKDPALFRTHLVEQAMRFVDSSGEEAETHYRLVGASHLLVNMLQPLVEGTEDEYITDGYEELRDGLDDLERIDVSNPSLNARLSSIFEELVELCMALGIVTSTTPMER